MSVAISQKGQHRKWPAARNEGHCSTSSRHWGTTQKFMSAHRRLFFAACFSAIRLGPCLPAPRNSTHYGGLALLAPSRPEFCDAREKWPIIDPCQSAWLRRILVELPGRRDEFERQSNCPNRQSEYEDNDETRRNSRMSPWVRAHVGETPTQFCECHTPSP